ncbi:VOC family protein [Lactobacillaceae bacterium Melli_B4]
MIVKNMDHFVLTVHNIDVSVSFYQNVLGMQVQTKKEHFAAMRFSNMKINFHQISHEREPKAELPTPGSGDLCFITEMDITDVINELTQKGVEIEEGPIDKHGALGPIKSVYFRDPDMNLVEVSNYL